jgi:ribose transport system permease protein
MSLPAPPPYPPRRAMPVLVPHLIWEPVLLVVTVGVTIAAAVRTDLFDSDLMWWTMAYFGLLASGLALSLRTATPNLSVAGVATASGVSYGWLVIDGELPTLAAAALVVIGALVFGAVLGAVTGLTSAPGWAVSLGGLAATQGLILGVIGPEGILVPEQLPGPLRYAGFWFAVFVLISIAGGVVFAVPAVRRLLSANRAATDPVRFDGGKLLGALVGMTGSSLLASLAGLTLVLQTRGAFPIGGDFGILVALAAVLIGGVSVFGGRGGIAGTVLGAALMSVVIRWSQAEDLPDSLLRTASWIAIVVAILAGLGLTRLFELLAPADSRAVDNRVPVDSDG